MTLIQVIRAFERIALNQPSIKMVVENDIFRLNACSDARYGVFGWTQQQHVTGIDSDTIDFNFTFYYVDRLTNDKRNQIEVQSVGIQTLNNILREMDSQGLYVNSTYTMQTFNQRFLDECAGVFCNVTISVPVTSLCEDVSFEFHGGYSLDFNDSFAIY